MQYSSSGGQTHSVMDMVMAVASCILYIKWPWKKTWFCTAASG